MSDAAEAPLHSTLVSFLTDVDSVRSSAALTHTLTQAIYALSSEAYKKFLTECVSQGVPKKGYTVPADKVGEFKRLQGEYVRSHRAGSITSRSFIVAIVSQYDVFLGSLVRELLRVQPGLVKSSSRTFLASEVLAFNSIDEAKETIIDDEIEALLRESHHEQFSWLERKFDIKTLRKDLDSWPAFVEVTQRRNLFVHSDGRISKQYKKLCVEHGVSGADKAQIGDQLDVGVGYVRLTADTLSEMAVKLTQVLWRKIVPSEIEDADKSLNEISYSLLERKRYQLAVKLLDFAFDSLKRHSNSEQRLRLVVNRANAYRLLGDVARSKAIISAEDWSATDAPFRMASQLLLGNLSDAVKTMRIIGSKGSVSIDNYREWPLFLGYKDEPDFKSAFNDIFGEEIDAPQVIQAEKPKVNKTPSILELADMLFAEDVILEVKVEPIKTELVRPRKSARAYGVDSNTRVSPIRPN